MLQPVEPPQSRTPSPFPEVDVASEEVAEEEAETIWNYKPRAPPRPLLGDTVFERDNQDFVLSIDGLTSNAYYEAEVYVRYRGIAAWEQRPALSASFRAPSSLENAKVQVRVTGPDGLPERTEVPVRVTGPNGLPERTEVPVEGNTRVAVHCTAREKVRNALQRAPRTPREPAFAVQEEQGEE